MFTEYNHKCVNIKLFKNISLQEMRFQQFLINELY